MIREIQDCDLDRIATIEKQLFLDSAWKKEEFEAEMLHNPYAKIYVYELDGRVVGYVDLWIAYENGEIANIAVDEAYQNQGIASQLLVHCLSKCEACENISLEVRVSNASAIHVYKKFHFHIVGTRKHYYENGEDAYLMVLDRRSL